MTLARHGVARKLASAVNVVLMLAVLGSAPSVAAGEAEGSPWAFEFEPYAWIPGTYGSVTVDGKTARLDVGPRDVLESVFDGNALAAAGYLSASYKRWSLFVDVLGGGAKVDIDETIPTPFCELVVDARDTMRFVLADLALGYRVAELSMPGRQRPLIVGVYAGARYVHLRNDLSGGVGVIGGRRFSGSAVDTTNWADPLIGVRWSVPVLDSVTLTFRGDIGGFGASSDLDWSLVGDLRYWLSWRPLSTRTYVAAGYRVVGFDRSPDAARVDMQLRGPLMGMGFVF